MQSASIVSGIIATSSICLYACNPRNELNQHGHEICCEDIRLSLKCAHQPVKAIQVNPQQTDTMTPQLVQQVIDFCFGIMDTASVDTKTLGPRTRDVFRAAAARVDSGGFTDLFALSNM